MVDLRGHNCVGGEDELSSESPVGITWEDAPMSQYASLNQDYKVPVQHTPYATLHRNIQNYYRLKIELYF